MHPKGTLQLSGRFQDMKYIKSFEAFLCFSILFCCILVHFFVATLLVAWPTGILPIGSLFPILRAHKYPEQQAFAAMLRICRGPRIFNTNINNFFLKNKN